MHYITSTVTQPVILGYVCPHCSSPILMVAQIRASAAKTYSFSRETAKEVTDQTAKQLVSLELERIKNCETQKLPLSSNSPHTGKPLSDCICTASIEFFDTPCPHCRQLAPWQISSSYRSQLVPLLPLNFPTVFLNNQDAIRWLNTIHQSWINGIHKARRDAELAATSLQKVTEGTSDLLQHRQIVYGFSGRVAQTRSENAISFPLEPRNPNEPEQHIEQVPPVSAQNLFSFKELRSQQTCTVTENHRRGGSFDYDYFPDDPTATMNSRIVSSSRHLMSVFSLLGSVAAIMWYYYAVRFLFERASVDNFLQSWAFLLLMTVIDFFSIWKAPANRKKVAGKYFSISAILLCLLLLPLGIYAL